MNSIPADSSADVSFTLGRDAERHKRFVDMAREVGASEDPKDFEKAFKKVVSQKHQDRKS
jgi:hypothetical protein